MAHYKIKNITGKLPKRHINKDTILKIEYHVGFQKKYRNIGVNDEMLLTCRTLPVSIHALRTKQLIIITEISENEFVKLQKPSAKEPQLEKVEKVVKPVKVIKETKITKKHKNNISESTVIIKK